MMADSIAPRRTSRIASPMPNPKKRTLESDVGTGERLTRSKATLEWEARAPLPVNALLEEVSSANDEDEDDWAPTAGSEEEPAEEYDEDFDESGEFVVVKERGDDEAAPEEAGIESADNDLLEELEAADAEEEDEADEEYVEAADEDDEPDYEYDELDAEPELEEEEEDEEEEDDEEM